MLNRLSGHDDVVDIDVWVNVKAIVVFAARDDTEARDS
jgi:hypothetical protein